MSSPSAPSVKPPPGPPSTVQVRDGHERTEMDAEPETDITRRMPLDESDVGEVHEAHQVPDALAAGDQLGDYVIDGVIGEGGGGTVYAGRHLTLGHRAAIKVLHRDMASFPTMVARFVREAAAVNKIRHPNIVNIFEFNEVEPGRPYYVMELLEGTDLRRLLRVHGRFSPREALTLLEPVCAAVQAAHEGGIVHRDIKASNVFIVDGTRAIKLLDFGIAKMLHGEGASQGLTEPGVMLGTAHNMAPEQIRCERADARTDIYALGILFFQVLTGHYPFHAEDPRTIALLHLQAPVPRPSASAPVPPAVDAVIMRCLEKKPDRRYASVADLITALRAAIGDPAPLPKGELAPAIGVYVEVRTKSDDLDDEMMEDIGNVLDAVEQAFGAAGFALPMHTSNAILGVRVAGAEGLSAETTRAEATVQGLCDTLQARDGRHPQVEVVVSLRAGEAQCRPSGNGIEVVGGPLLEVGTWPEESRLATA